MATTRAIKAGPRRSVFSKFEISPNLDAIARVGRPGRPARPRQQHQRVPRHRPHPWHPRTTGDYARLLDITKWEGAQVFFVQMLRHGKPQHKVSRSSEQPPRVRAHRAKSPSRIDLLYGVYRTCPCASRGDLPIFAGVQLSLLAAAVATHRAIMAGAAVE